MEVILFSTNCPKCRVLQKKLDAAKIQSITFQEVDTLDDIDRGDFGSTGKR